MSTSPNCPELSLVDQPEGSEYLKEPYSMMETGKKLRKKRARVRKRRNKWINKEVSSELTTDISLEGIESTNTQVKSENLSSLQKNTTTTTLAHTLDKPTEATIKKPNQPYDLQKSNNVGIKIAVLHEQYRGNVKFVEKEIEKSFPREHECIVEVNGTFCSKAVAKTKKMAKRRATEKALDALNLKGELKKKEQNKRNIILDADSVKTLRLAGIKTFVNRNKLNVYRCTICVAVFQGSDKYLRNHIRGYQHLVKMSKIINTGEWNEVMKVIKGETENKFQNSTDLSDLGVDHQVLRHILGRKFFCIACERVIVISTKNLGHTKDAHIISIEHQTALEEKGLVRFHDLRTSSLPRDNSNFLPYEYENNAIYEDKTAFQHPQYIQEKASILIKEEHPSAFKNLSQEDILKLSGIRKWKKSYHCINCEKYFSPSKLEVHCCTEEHLKMIANNLDLYTWQEVMVNLGYNLSGSKKFEKLDSATHAALELGGLRQVNGSLFYCTVCSTTMVFGKPEMIKDHISAKKHAGKMKNSPSKNLDSNQLYMALDNKYSAYGNDSAIPRENVKPAWTPNQFSSSLGDAETLSSSNDPWDAPRGISSDLRFKLNEKHQKRTYEDDEHGYDVSNYGDMLSSRRTMESNSSHLQNTQYAYPGPSVIDNELVRAADEIKRLREEASEEIKKLRMEAEMLKEENLQLKVKKLAEEAEALREENRRLKGLPEDSKKRPLPSPSWNNDLESLRREKERVGRQAKRSCQEEDWDNFKEATKNYKKEVRKNKRQARREICELNAKLQNEESQSPRSYFREMVEAHQERQNQDMSEISKEINQKLFGGNRLEIEARDASKNPAFYGNYDNILNDRWLEGEKTPHYGSKFDEPSTTTGSKYGNEYNTHGSSRYDRSSASYGNKYGSHDSSQYNQPSTSYGNRYGSIDSGLQDQPSTSYGNEYNSRDNRQYNQPSTSFINRHDSSRHYDQHSTSYRNRHNSNDEKDFNRMSSSYEEKRDGGNNWRQDSWKAYSQTNNPNAHGNHPISYEDSNLQHRMNREQYQNQSMQSRGFYHKDMQNLSLDQLLSQQKDAWRVDKHW